MWLFTAIQLELLCCMNVFVRYYLFCLLSLGIKFVELAVVNCYLALQFRIVVEPLFWAMIILPKFVYLKKVIQMMLSFRHL